MTTSDRDVFVLDPRLAADSLEIGDLAISHVRLMSDARYPWLLLIPKRAGVSELFELANRDRAMLVEEAAFVAQVLKDVTRCRKVNVAALGNNVAQLHIHVVARFEDDAAWPLPIWGHGERKPYDPAGRNAMIELLRRRLSAARVDG